MNTQSNLSDTKIILILFIIMVFFGCAGSISKLEPDEKPVTSNVLLREESSEQPPVSVADSVEPMEMEEKYEDIIPIKTEELDNIASVSDIEEREVESHVDGSLPVDQETKEKSDQEILDSALGFCEVSNDLWEQGDLDGALDALDQAYSLILKVNPDQEPQILQQRDDLRITISKRIIECYSSRFTVANGYHKAIPLIMNMHVEKALEQFKGRNRQFFLDSYRRSGRYRPYIVMSLKEAGLPEELSWLPLIESGFKVKALSRARALGPWQFIASTGHKFGLKRNQWIDERMDIEKSTTAAIAYLKELHQIFGDWTTVLAAYNCGEGTVLKRIRAQSINYLDNFWDLYRELPRETAFYVPKFMAVIHIMNDPEAHGFTLPPVEDEIEKDKVTCQKQMHLKRVAEHLGINSKFLKDLNPSLKYHFTPSEPYELKVPKGYGPVLLSKLSDIPVYHPPVPYYVVHRVRSGESLSVIARKYRTSVRKIVALNGLRSRRYIKAGWKLKVPTRRLYSSSKRISASARSSVGKGGVTKHVVRRGDSLWKIANKYGTTTKAIMAKNNLRSTSLGIGEVVMIPVRNAASISLDVKTKIYKVLEGDSSYMIAQKHNMNLSEFLKLNQLTSKSTIFPGQVLLVRAK